MSKSIQLNLEYPFLYQWKHQGPVSILSNFSGDSADDLNQISNESEAVEKVKKIEGSFALIINQDDFFFAAVDRIRSFPLFYSLQSDAILFRDHLSEESNYQLDESAILFFEINSCTHGQNTLLKDWKQLLPGEYLYYEKKADKLTIKRYFSFAPILQEKPLDVKAMKEIYLSTFRKILSKIGDRPIVIALSAGYDSRSIVSVLAELNVKNIFAYTYGVKNSYEIPIAKQIALKLNLDWHFVEYSEDLLKEFFSDSWEKYAQRNHNFSSLPGEQDFFALTYLKKKNLLPKNGVVLSGFLGDCLGGSIFKNDFVPRNRLEYQDDHMSNFASKYIVNTVRAYEYFGLEWYAVLMEPSILEAWFQIPLKERCYKNGYNDFLRHEFFIPLGIDFLKENHFYHPQYFKNYSKIYLPKRLVKYIQKRRAAKLVDINNINFLNEQLSIRLTQKQPSSQLNVTHGRYFIENLQKKANKH
ncbi:MAG: asparagine synthase-related protein [Ginsengibacter sp.]|jgi:asparagine synthase (glutamine-hydrolysing)